MTKKKQKSLASKVASIKPVYFVAGVFLLIAVAVVGGRGVEAQNATNGVTLNLSEQTIVKLLDRFLGVDSAPEASVGAFAGPDIFQHVVFKDGYTKSGTDIATSSTAASYTLDANEWRNRTSYISWTPNVNLTLTTMASSSAPLSGLKTGESLEFLFYNASTTAASTVTFAAGTGVDLQEDEGETVIVNGLEIARLTFVKKADSDVILWVEAGQVGD